MTQPDTRYAGGCLDWTRYDVPTLAGFLDADLSSGWSQVSAWWQAHDLTREHLTVMRQARDTIVRVWPPGTNQAAAAYVDQLDALIASMDTMRTAAEANAQALGGILTTLTRAKSTVDDLHTQWRQQPSTWETDASLAAAVATMDPKAIAVATLARDRKSALNAKAQEVMRTTDQSVYEYLPRLTVVSPISTSGVYHPTPVAPGPAPANGNGSRSGATSSVRRPVIPPAALPADSGSWLAGGGAVGPGTVPGGGNPLGRPAPPPTAGPVTPTGPGFAVPTSAWTQTSVGRVLRSGAVLGAPPETPPGQRAVGQPTGDEARPSQAGMSGSEPEAAMLGGGAGGLGRAADRRRTRTLPPDTEWPVAQGVRPVLEPGPEPVHDPGPGVIGIDR